MRDGAKTVLLGMVFVLVLGYFGSRFGQMQKGVDFPDFYAAARMVQGAPASNSMNRLSSGSSKPDTAAE